MTKLTPKTRRAIVNYGEHACREAYLHHYTYGDGAGTIAAMFNLTTRQADAAIDAGRELFNVEDMPRTSALVTLEDWRIDAWKRKEAEARAKLQERAQAASV